MLSWVRFSVGLAASFYVLMTFSLFVHEVLGHGVAWAVFGARRLVVSVGPGFAGYVRGDHDPAPLARQVIIFAGIGANTLVGLGALAVARWRRPSLTPLGLALFWVVTTELGQALGYTLMGIVFNQGDAENLPLAWARWPLAAVVLVLFLAMANWSLNTIARFVCEHFQPPDLRALRRTFVLGFGLPLGAIVVLAPGYPGRELWTIVAFDAAILAVLAAGTFWMVRRMPAESEKRGHPITWGEASAWGAAALATFFVTWRWLDSGIVVPLR
ncbi:MAG: hypothetical protein ACAI25_09250 [Planctomycetota bacterium]